MTDLVFGNVKHPPFIDRVIPDSETAAYNYLGPLQQVGVDQHSMIGSLWGTDRWFRRGRGVSTGLTNYGIGNSTDGAESDGLVIRWNRADGKALSVDYTDADGTRHKGPVSAHRSGWANGGSDGLEGDGPLFVRTLGIDAINRRLVSIERSDGGIIGTPMSAKQFASICALTAYWFDVCKVPWDRFPFNPHVGCVTHLLHKETATKDCPFPAVYNRIDDIQDRVRAILKAAQTHADGGTTVPPVNPPKPDHNAWPFPVDDLEKRFGKVPIRQIDGSIKAAGFNVKGAISNAWAARAVKDGIKKTSDIPRPLQGFEAVDAQGLQQTIITFDGKGKDTWILFRPAREVSWQWLG